MRLYQRLGASSQPKIQCSGSQLIDAMMATTPRCNLNNRPKVVRSDKPLAVPRSITFIETSPLNGTPAQILPAVLVYDLDASIPNVLADGAYYHNCAKYCRLPIHFGGNLRINTYCLVMPAAADILVYSGNAEEHAKHLDAVLLRLQENSLCTKPEKCEIFEDSVGFLGYVITKDSLRTDSGKVAAVKDWRVPELFSDVRVFLVLNGYYRRFVNDCVQIAMPVTNLMATKEFVWNDEAESAFNELKERPSSAPIIKQFDSKQAIRAETPPFYFGPKLLNGT